MTTRVVVASVAHDVADARLHRLVDALLAHEAGFDVTVLGRGDASDGPAGATVLVSDRQGASGRVRDHLPVLRQHADVLLTVDPDLVLTGRLWRSARRGRHHVVDLHEDYAAVALDRPWVRGWSRPFVRAGVGIVVRTAAAADLTLVADEHVPPRRARRRLVVRNLPDPSWLPDPRTPREPSPRAVHIGDLRASRGLFTMIDAVRDAPAWTLDLVGRCSDADRAEAVRRAGPAAERVRFHGMQPPRRSWRIAAGAWVGLALLADTPAYDRAMPTKVYEYAGSGLAVLTTPRRRTAAFVRDTEIGVVVEDAAGAAEQLRRWADDPSALTAHRDAATRWARTALTGPSPFAAAADAVHALVRGD